MTDFLKDRFDRRTFIRGTGKMAGAAAAACCLHAVSARAETEPARQDVRRGAQRLSLARLQEFEALGYGMFISYDVQAFVSHCLHHSPTDDDRRLSPSIYAPDKLDVDQWVSVARDAGMKYAVLTAKRHPGFCLWPSKYTDFTVANSGNKTDVVAEYVKACEKRAIQPGLYYPSLDIHHLSGRPPKDDWKYVTSLHQTFMTNQLTELLTNYGPISEIWIDIPRVLGRGYRTFLYEHMARLQPNAVILMNSGFHDGADVAKRVDSIWPTDLISLERTLPPQTGYSPWKTIEGQEHYLPGEFCDSIMEKNWYWKEGEKPKPHQDLLAQYQACRKGGVNLLLDAPPDNHGLIPQSTIDALMRLRRSAEI